MEYGIKMMNKIKAIIFDFGGVFKKNDDFVKFWQKNAKEFNVDEDFIIKKSLEIWLQARVGEIDSNIFWEEQGRAVGMSTEEFKTYFINSTSFCDELLEYVKNNLVGKYKLAILSNQIESWFELIIKKRGLKEIFNPIVTSYNEKVAKPDIEIYKRTIEKIGEKAENCIYIDDVAKNLEPAKQLGMKTVLFKEYRNFLEDLNNILNQ